MTTPRQTRLLRVAGLRAFQRAIGRAACHPDLSRTRSTTVIVPSRAAADQLTRTLENRALADPGGAAGHRALLLPDIVTRAEWYSRLHERLPAPPPRLTALERDVLAAAAARDAAGSGTPAPFTPRAGLLVEMLALYDELRRRHQTVDSFERLLAGDLETAA